MLSAKEDIGAVTNLAFSPSCDLLAIASKYKAVKVLDATTGRESFDLQENTYWGTSVAFSPDGKFLAIGFFRRLERLDGYEVGLWEVATGRKVRTLGRKDKTEISSLVFTSNSKHLASASAWGKVKVWDVDTGRELQSLDGHTCAAFSPDGKRLATVTGNIEEETVSVWNLATGRRILTLTGHNGFITSVAFSPRDGRRLASASLDRTVKVWDSETGQELVTLKGYTDYVTSIAFSPDGKRLASASRDGTVKIWETALAEQDTEFKRVGLPPSELAFRKAKARFDPYWHKQEAAEAEEKAEWFAAVFHRALLAENAPWDLENWAKLQDASSKLGDSRRARAVCDHLLQRDPSLAPIYLQRSLLRLRKEDIGGGWADFFRCVCSSLLDHPDWIDFAVAANKLGDEAAKKKDWPRAMWYFTLVSAWKPHDLVGLHRLAWARLAAGDEVGFRSACRRMYSRFGKLNERRDLSTLSVMLGLRMHPLTPTQPVIDGFVHHDAATRADTITWTATLLPNCGIDAEVLLKLAVEAVVVDTRNSAYLETLGAALYRAGKYTDAVEQLTKAVELQDADSSNWQRLFLAMAYHRLGDRSKAREWFGKAKLDEKSGWEDRLLFERLRQEATALFSAKDNHQP